MLLYFSGYLIVPLEVICCKIFFETFCMDKKIKRLHSVLFWGLLCIFIYIPAIFFVNSVLLKQIAVIGIIAVATKTYWKITYKKSFMLTFLFQSLVLMADYITVIINSSILMGNINPTVQAFLILLTKMVLFLMVIIIKSILKQSQLKFLDDVAWIKFLFFPLFTICIIIAFISKPELMVNEKQNQIFWVFAFGLVGMNSMLFYLLQDVAKRERELFERRMFEREAKHKYSLYESMAEATKQQQTLSHEYQNQLICIQSLLHSQQYNKLEEYVKKLTGVVLKDLDYMNTNNVIVNAILNEKYVRALEQGVVMVCKVNNLEKMNIEDQDIALLLSNLLNNALEACQKYSDEKVIKVKFVLEEDEVVLSVKNTYDGNIIISEGNYITTKENKRNHGIGIKNMIQVIEKYDGFYSITYDERYFSFSCVIPR